MSITVRTADLRLALAHVAPLAERKSTLPILASVLVKAASGNLTVAATDLNITAVATLACTGDDGEFTLDAAKLLAIVKGLPGAAVEFAPEAGHTRVACGALSYRLVSLPARDFPKLPKALAKPQPVDGAALAALIGAVAYAVSGDDSRYHLSGALLDGKVLAATDGHRLALAELAKGVKGKALVPRAALAAIKRLCERRGAVELELDEAHIAARAALDDDGTAILTLTAKAIDAQFPPYNQAIPAAHKTMLTIDREALRAAVRRVALVCGDKSHSLALAHGEKYQADNGLIVSTDNPELGEASEHMELVAAEGEPFRVGANAYYLGEALAAMPGESVRLFVSGVLDPLMLRPATADLPVAVIMPMRI